jgi:hypothetical protein
MPTCLRAAVSSSTGRSGGVDAIRRITWHHPRTEFSSAVLSATSSALMRSSASRIRAAAARCPAGGPTTRRRPPAAVRTFAMVDSVTPSSDSAARRRLWGGDPAPRGAAARLSCEQQRVAGRCRAGEVRRTGASPGGGPAASAWPSCRRTTHRTRDRRCHAASSAARRWPSSYVTRSTAPTREGARDAPEGGTWSIRAKCPAGRTRAAARTARGPSRDLVVLTARRGVVMILHAVPATRPRPRRPWMAALRARAQPSGAR